MATTLATITRNAKTDAACALANGGKIRLKSAAGTVLCDVPLAATAFGASSSGTAALASAPRSGTGLAAAGAGTAATQFDICQSNNTVLWSGTVEQGDGESPADGVIELDNPSIAQGQTVNITGYNFTTPP